MIYRKRPFRKFLWFFFTASERSFLVKEALEKPSEAAKTPRVFPKDLSP
jgi:hypothetical protein